jgi:hypothetical protein
MFWIPHFMDNRLTDGGKIVSLTHRPLFNPRSLPVLISVALKEIRVGGMILLK